MLIEIPSRTKVIDYSHIASNIILILVSKGVLLKKIRHT